MYLKYLKLCFVQSNAQEKKLFLIIFIKSNPSTQCGTWTHDSEVKSAQYTNGTSQVPQKKSFNKWISQSICMSNHHIVYFICPLYLNKAEQKFNILLKVVFP